MNRSNLTTAVAFVLAAALTACDTNTDNTSTPAPSSSSTTTPPPAAPQTMATPLPGNTPAARSEAEGGETLAWTLPKGWKENPESKPMRMATLLSDTNVEVSVTGFDGNVGGTLANINRWRGQIGLPPIDETDVAKNTAEVQTASGTATLVDATNPKPESPDQARLIAALIPGKSKTFFIKMGPGPSDRLEQAKPGFLELVKSAKISG